MKNYYYDLHTHSCLSPCADNDNTPNNLAGMAALSEIEILALTDHNTAKNCPAFFEAAERYGIIPVAGVELTTSEDIHAVCLFEKLEDAMRFDKELEGRRLKVKNRPDIFGEQLILDGMDNVIGTEDYLLSYATDISIEDAPELVDSFGGVCYPAHIDRDANGIIAVLGTLPETPHFTAVEFHFGDKVSDYATKYDISGKTVVVSSDAHCLTDVRDKENYFELSPTDDSPEAVRRELFKLLRSGS